MTPLVAVQSAMLKLVFAVPSGGQIIRSLK
jgi:hypothetical protein